MSLVEKALKKLQDSRTGKPEAAVLDIDASDMRLTPSAGAQTTSPPRPMRKRIEIARSSLRMAGLLAPEHQDREISDQYRQIKRPLLAAVGGEQRDESRFIMVASAMPGEGKTFTSINLAISMAMEKDIDVLLVDADVPKPHVSHQFGLEREQGLLDALTDPSTDVESLIVDTDLARLSLLPVGSRMDAATELFGSLQMQRLMKQLIAAEPRRVVILDSPPLLLTQESRALAQIVGQVVLVIRAGVTPQKAVADAISYLNPEKAIGLVLNQSDATSSDGYYYGMSAYEGASTSAAPRG